MSKLSTTSALVILFEKESQSAVDLYNHIQEARKKYDKNYCRWPVHINLMFPFVIETMSSVGDKLGSICRSFPPFSFQLGKFNFFEHKNSCTVILEPTKGAEYFQRLLTLLLEQYPQYQQEIDRIGGVYHPHLSIGKTKTKQQAINLISSLSSSWQWFQCEIQCTAVTWLQNKQGSFQPSLSVGLSTKLPLVPQHTQEEWQKMVVSRSYGKEWQEIPTWQWNVKRKTWVCVAAPTSKQQEKKSLSSFIVLTYNVLFDIAEKTEGINHDVRLQGVISLLRVVDVDILSLQEVTPRILKLLLEEKWIRRSYHVTDCLENGASTVNPYGQLILSRVPLTKAYIYEFSPLKRVLAASASIFGISTLVVSLHLTAGSSGDPTSHIRAQKKRKEQLSIIQDFILPHSEIILAGDWNCGSLDDLAAMKNIYSEKDLEQFCYALDMPHGFVDVVSNADFLDRITFDPASPTARHTIIEYTEVKRRIDRMGILSKNYAPRSCIRIGGLACNIDASSSDWLLPSDHYGVLSVLSPVSEEYKAEEWKERHFLAFMIVKMLVAAALPWETIHCYRVGSSSLGVANEESDLDTVCIGTVSATSFFSAIRKAAEQGSNTIYNIKFCRYITEAIVPVTVLSINGLDVDIQYCQSKSVPLTNRLGMKTLFGITPVDESSKLALNSMLDSIIVLGTLKKNSLYDRFVFLYSFISRWAKERKVYGGYMGYLSGTSICILCGTSLLLASEDEVNPTKGCDIENFFSLYSEWDWSLPVCFPFDGNVFPSEQFVVESNELMDIRTPYGCKNIHRNMNRSTFRHIVAEIRNGTFWRSDRNTHVQKVLDYGVIMDIEVRIQLIEGMNDIEVNEWLGFCKSRISGGVSRLEQFFGAGYLILPSLHANEIHFLVLRQGYLPSPFIIDTIQTVKEIFRLKHSQAITRGKIYVRISS